MWKEHLEGTYSGALPEMKKKFFDAKGYGSEGDFINKFPPNLVLNGTFDDSFVPWSDVSDLGGVAGVVGKSLHLINGTAPARANHDISFEDGETYRLTCTVSGAPVSAYHANSLSIGVLSIGDNNVTFDATSGSDKISLRNFGAGTTAIVDNIVIRKVI